MQVLDTVLNLRIPARARDRLLTFDFLLSVLPLPLLHTHLQIPSAGYILPALHSFLVYVYPEFTDAGHGVR